MDERECIWDEDCCLFAGIVLTMTSDSDGSERG
jgi:hypothetical protein